MAKEIDSVEWVIMFRLGLTPARIADLCEVPIQNVTRALGWAKRREPRLEEEHVINAPKRSEISLRWAGRCLDLKSFVAENGRMPFAKGRDQAEVSLGRWLAKQRALAERDKLAEEERCALNAVGDWEVTPRAHQDNLRWQVRLSELGDFVTAERRLPSHRRAASEKERLLGTWLHGQRQRALNGLLSPDQLRSLQDRTPGWNTWRDPTANRTVP